MIESKIFEISTMFSVSILFVILAGVLTAEFFRRSIPKNEFLYMFVVLSGSGIYVVLRMILFFIPSAKMQLLFVIYSTFYFVLFFLLASLLSRKSGKFLLFSTIIFFFFSVLINLLQFSSVRITFVFEILISFSFLLFSIFLSFMLIKFIASYSKNTTCFYAKLSKS